MSQKIWFLAAALMAAFGLASCNQDGQVPQASTSPAAGTLRLDYTHNADYSTYGNIFAVWAESADGSYIQPFYICERLMGADPDDGTVITDQAEVLPWWHLSKLPLMDADQVDAVTGPTLRKQDFTLDLALADSAPRKFTLYFETDVSFNSNDWFGDQPAVLYSVQVDLDAGAGDFPLVYRGWTPHASNIDAARTATGESSLQVGAFQTEGRYITNFAADSAAPSPGSFGSSDSRSQTSMVAGLSLHVE